MSKIFWCSAAITARPCCTRPTTSTNSASSFTFALSPGEFLGYQPMSKRNPPPADPGKPLCWMPQNVDNSSGGQTWVTSERWGPFKDYMLHTSYGAAALLRR